METIRCLLDKAQQLTLLKHPLAIGTGDVFFTLNITTYEVMWLLLHATEVCWISLRASPMVTIKDSIESKFLALKMPSQLMS